MKCHRILQDKIAESLKIKEAVFVLPLHVYDFTDRKNKAGYYYASLRCPRLFVWVLPPEASLRPWFEVRSVSPL